MTNKKSQMYDDLERLYDKGKGKLTEVGLDNAVGKKWITEEEKKEIIESKVE